MDNLQKDTEYKIEVGETISNNNSSTSNEYHSLFFNFKPKTLKENNWEGSFDIDAGVVDSYSSASPASLTANSKFVFKGTYVPNNKSNVHECVLIYDRHSETFRLEKLKATTAFTSVVDTASNPPPTLSHSSSSGKIKTIASGVTETIAPSNRSVQLLGQPKQTTPPKKVTPPPNNLDIDGPVLKKRKEETILPPIVQSLPPQQPMSMMQQILSAPPMKPMGLGQRPGEIDAKSALDDSSASDDSDSSDSDSSDSSDSEILEGKAYHHQSKKQHSENDEEAIDILSFTEFDQWTTHQATSVLCTRKRSLKSSSFNNNLQQEGSVEEQDSSELILFKEGGVGLWSYHVKPLFDNGFCGSDLLMIRDDIEKGGMRFACSELTRRLRSDDRMLLDEEYCREIVTWVEECLRQPEESLLEISLVDFEELEQSMDYVIYRVTSGVDIVKKFSELKLIEEMAFKNENEKLKQQLGGLFKNPWPFTSSGLDWRFYPVLVESFQERDSENEILNINNYLKTKIKETDRKGGLYILNSPSGSGKSFSISHIACTNTAFLLNINLGLADDSILTLLASFIEVESTHGKKSSRHSTTELLYMIFNVQLILMQTLLKSNPLNFTPFNWWIYLNSYVGRDHLNIVFKQLLEYEQSIVNFESYKLFKYLQRTIREKIGQKTLVFSIDDMEVIETLTEGTIKSKLDPATLVGKVFNSLLSYPHNSAIVSGSNISHKTIRHLTSELKRDYEIISGYGVISSNEVYNFIDKLLNVKKVLSDSYVQILTSLAKGRRGILFEWLENIASSKPFDPSQGSIEEWATRVLTSSMEKVLERNNSLYKKRIEEMNVKDMDVAALKDVVVQNLSVKGFINVDELNHQLGLVTRGTNSTSLLDFITRNELAFTVPSTSDSSSYYRIPEPLLMYSLNKTIILEELIRVSNSWLKKVLKRSDYERGFVIEIVCGLVMAKISRELNGRPLSDHILFKSSQNEQSFLENFTLNPNLMIVHSEDIWKLLIGSHKYDYKFEHVDISMLYGTSLDINLRWDGLMLGKPINSTNQKNLIITCGAKMINSSIHPEQFLMNLQSTSISNGFLTKDLKRTQPKCEDDRKLLTSLLNTNSNQDIFNLRILFDYTADASQFEYLSSKEKIPVDIEPRIKSKIVVLSRHNPVFYQWFKESLPETFEIFERYWTKYCYIR